MSKAFFCCFSCSILSSTLVLALTGGACCVSSRIWGCVTLRSLASLSAILIRYPRLLPVIWPSSLPAWYPVYPGILVGRFASTVSGRGVLVTLPVMPLQSSSVPSHALEPELGVKSYVFFSRGILSFGIASGLCSIPPRTLPGNCLLKFPDQPVRLDSSRPQGGCSQRGPLPGSTRGFFSSPFLLEGGGFSRLLCASDGQSLLRDGLRSAGRGYARR
mmetsp:Transcript_30485/g.76652  ORF Transcript_30485/g.76652 Transcript_30485/m.76652 type:complete len:217 (-) Transcript_30485:33-683(-)